MLKQISFFLVALIFLVGVPNALAIGARIRSITPHQVQAGATAFPIVVTGSNFPKNAQVQVNGMNLETIALAWNKLKATIPASMVANTGTLEVKVGRKNRFSNPMNLVVSNSPGGNYNWAALTTKLQTFVPGTVNGMTAMISRHGNIVYSQGFGNQTVNSVLPIASSTKMPSMLAIMTLVDEGRLNLDVPISTYLNGYAVVPADKANITMRMLMNHISGVAQDDCLNNQQTTTLQACTQSILNSPLGFAPGMQFSYGGSSMQIAGGVVEAITNESWNAYFARKVGTPLGFNDRLQPELPSGIRFDRSLSSKCKTIREIVRSKLKINTPNDNDFELLSILFAPPNV